MSLLNTEPIELPTAVGKQLRRLADRLELEPFDLLLVGHGSGNTYRQAAGWACTAYDRLEEKVFVHAGAATVGTNNFAELAPYVQNLWFHRQDHRTQPGTAYQVRIVSTSEVTVRCGNREYTRWANGCLWAAIAWFEQDGYAINWHHVRRDSNRWNEFANSIAARSRSLIEDVKDGIVLK